MPEPNAAAPASTGSADLYGSGKSDLDILNDESFLSADTGATADDAGAQGNGAADATDGASSTEGGASAAAATEEVVPPEWLGASPQEMQDLWGRKDLSPTAREFIGKLYEETQQLKSGPLGTPEAVAELNEAFPGGVEDIRVAVENSQTFAKEREQFGSGDPTQQAEFLGSMLQESPDAYVSAVGVAVDLLKQTLRDDYQAFRQPLVREAFEEASNGKYGTFMDSIVGMVNQYNALDPLSEQAQQIASKLAGSALKMGEWWADSKEKLGFTKDGAAPASTSGRPPVIPINRNEPDAREMALGQKEELFFQSQAAIRHDEAINPIILRSMDSELKARGMTLPEAWRNRVKSEVGAEILKNILQDKQFIALRNRILFKGKPDDFRIHDRSETVMKQLVNAAKGKAEKIVATLIKGKVSEIAELTGKKAKPAPAGGAVRSGGTARTSTSLVDEDFKNEKLSDVDLLNKTMGIGN